MCLLSYRKCGRRTFTASWLRRAFSDPPFTQEQLHLLQVCLLNYKKGGFPFWNQFFLAPIHDSSGVVEYYLGIQSDVTEQVESARLARTCLEGASASVPHS